MNQSFLFLSIIFFCLLSCSNTFPPEGSDLAVRELKGSVKFVNAKTYWAKKRAKPFDLDNLRLEDDFRDPSKRLWYFNEVGNITKSSYFNGNKLKWEFIDSYDNRGNRMLNHHYDYSREKVLDRTQVFTYDTNDNLVQKALFDIDSLLVSNEVISYNELQQKVKEEVTSSKSNRITHTATFKYDTNGRVIEKKEKRWQNPSLKIIYTYDGSSLHKSTKTVYKEDSILTRKEIYVYRSGNQLKERTFIYPLKGYKRTALFNKEGWVADVKQWELSEASQPTSHLRYVYKHDAKGNWTKRATFINEVLSQVEFRTIEYY